MDFILYGKNFKIVAKDGLPEDGDFVIAVFGNEKTGYSWQPASYYEDKENFYADMGYGGLVLDEKDCVAWLKFDELLLEQIIPQPLS